MLEDRDIRGPERGVVHVNRGIGFSVVPMRINCRPELTWLTLDPGSPR